MFLAMAAAVLVVIPLAGARAQDGKAPASSRRAGGGNAAEVYGKAFTLLEERRPRGMTAEEYDELVILTGNGRVLPKDVDRVRELMTKASPFLQAIEPANGMRRSDFELDRTKGFELALPHLADMRSAARLLRAEAALALHDGDWDTTLSSMQSLGWLANHSGQDQVLISSLVGGAISQLSLTSIDAVLDDGTLTQERAKALLEGLRGMRGDDPFRFGDSMRGEYQLLRESVAGMDGAALASVLLEGSDQAQELRALGPRELAQAMGRARGVYDLAARALETGDPEVAKQLMEQIDREVAGNPLLMAYFPAIERALRIKQMNADELASRFERLEAIAAGKKTALQMANASTWFRRAAAMASSIPEEGQEALVLALAGGRTIDPALLDRAERLMLGAGRQIRESIERGLACGVIDFDLPNDADYGLSAKWLPGLRGACRTLLAQATITRDAKERAALVDLVVRTAATLTKDPSALRVVAARSIADEAMPALKTVAAERALDAEARAKSAASLRALATALLASGDAALKADRDRLAVGSPWGRIVDDRRRKVLSRRGQDFLLFLQVALAPASWFPMAESPDVGAKGPLVQFDDLLPPEACAAAQKQAEAVRKLRFFDALRSGPDPEADAKELSAFRGVTAVPIRDHGKDFAQLSAANERLAALADALERVSE